ncbi:rhomboid family intramembrane serine protease [Alienimonas californiensis]|uniref:Rhomboid family protein n=1 Tax=Alienimonas californiensis TaxID=2527989 RepID=A0A517P7Q3_9PLAN|nr:rhomboid family intramembrane serine protease [Alienimonas californiensis]QDT15383.1 Rhomboid family protein [Alienimonas californiensis]
MFIPVGTDAPIYHFPFATIFLAVVNVGAHVWLGQVDPDTFGLSGTKQDWSLWFGEGLHPLQWVTSCFLHAGWFHLIGNLIFLWGFGIIVEGKLGWWRFLLLYVAIGATACGIEQVALLPGWLTELPRAQMEHVLIERGEDPEEVEDALDLIGYPEHVVALGASGAIFGLVAISMIWAPRNDLDVLWIIWYRGGISEVSILAFSMLYIGLELVTLGIQASVLGPEYAVSSAFLHTTGALVGAIAGTALLKWGWVDCENWDLFAVLKGTHGNRDEFELQRSTYQRELTVPTQAASGAGAVAPGEELPAAAPSRPGRKAKKTPRRPVDAFARLRKHLEGGDGISALGEWETLIGSRPKLVPPEPDLFALAEAVDKANFPEEAASLFALYLRSYPKPKPDDAPPAEGEEPRPYDAAHAGVIRLRAARRLLERPGRRAQAATLLRGVDGAALSPKQRQMLDKLTAAAG